MENIQYKELPNGQILLNFGIKRYKADLQENGTWNLLKNRDIYNNPKHKYRFKFIKNFKNLDDVLNFIKKYKKAI
ncbi:hypothetical protein KM803_15230 [Clostridium tyrobutyricum]|uniref:hypothetical protein n=1 Tax=Clostridium tyrobutyricum TaxID=1519 RepID=UPI001C38E635|nr:hypothetical protein [Clostridium tyrobutyricum]MBV4432657.1 hypothetical protein [Clostridium tyrobutyricum]